MPHSDYQPIRSDLKLVLRLLAENWHRVDLDTGQVFRCSRTYQVLRNSGSFYVHTLAEKELAPYPGNAEGHLYVRLYGALVLQQRGNTASHANQRRTKITKSLAVHRLVWMAGAGVPIPWGFEIHHRNSDVEDNRFVNLFCLHRTDHEKLHYHDNRDLMPDDQPF